MEPSAGTGGGGAPSPRPSSAAAGGPVESVHSIRLEDVGPFDSSSLGNVTEVPLVESDGGAAPAGDPGDPGDPGEHDGGQDQDGAGALPWTPLSSLSLSGLDELPSLPVEDADDESPEAAVEDGDSASQDKGAAVVRFQDTAVDAEGAAVPLQCEDPLPAAGPPPPPAAPDTQGILAKTVWADPDAFGLRQALRDGVLEDSEDDGEAQEADVPFWDVQVAPPRNLAVRVSASHIRLPSASAYKTPVVDVTIEEVADEGGGSLQVAAEAALEPPGAPGTLAPPASADRGSRVEFSASVETVFAEEAERVPASPEAAPVIVASVIPKKVHPGDEAEERTASDTAEVLEATMDEDVSSLRAELLQQSGAALEPVYTVQQYEVEVRAEPADGAGAAEDVLVQFTTAAGRPFRKVYKIHANMLEVKEDLAAFFCCSVTEVALDTSTVQVDDSLPLAGAGVEAGGVRLCIRVARRAKPFLGGWRDSRSGTEFHHAESQTGPPSRAASLRASREVQAVRTRRRRTNTGQDKATQVPRPDLYIPGLRDRVLAGDAARFLAAGSALEAKVRVIQRCFRAFVLRRRLQAEVAEDAVAAQGPPEEEAEAEDSDEEGVAVVLAQSTPSPYPRTREDFAVLRALVERWRRAETRRIAASNSEAARRALAGEVLAQEVVLLEAIERHRQVVRREAAVARERRLLARCSAPVVFRGSDGDPVEVETVRVGRGRELSAAYAGLTTPQASTAERIAFLASFADALLELGTAAALEVRRLVRREWALLSRGLDKLADTAALRRRAAVLFVEVVKSAVADPAAALGPAAGDGAGPPGAPPRQRCVACTAGPRRDPRPARLIMEAVRRAEQRRGSYSSVAFVMRPHDFKVLLDLWLCRSALTGASEAAGPTGAPWGLEFPRWRAHLDWSPWNCVLLTAKEARAHVRLAEDPGSVYAADLVAAVRLRHLQARRTFARLAEMAVRDDPADPDVTVEDC